MKVEKFTKLRNGMYRLSLVNSQEIDVHEDLILQKNILLTREISDDDISNIEKLNNNFQAYDLALKYIGTKYRSCYEVYDYLNKKEIDREIIDEVMEKLKSQNYLNDEIFAKAFISDRIKFSNNGPHKIERELEDRKVSSEIINNTLSVFDSELEREKLAKLVPKYVKTIRNKSRMMMLKKVSDYFSNLGYDSRIINEMLPSIDYDDSASYKKEYEKWHDKLSKKYSGTELEFKIKQAMYRNGYK